MVIRIVSLKQFQLVAGRFEINFLKWLNGTRVMILIRCCIFVLAVRGTDMKKSSLSEFGPDLWNMKREPVTGTSLMEPIREMKHFCQIMWELSSQDLIWPWFNIEIWHELTLTWNFYPFFLSLKIFNEPNAQILMHRRSMIETHWK